MNGSKSLFVCVLIVLLGNNFVWAQAKAPEGGASPKPTPKAEPTPPVKSAAAEGSSGDKSDASEAGRENLASIKKIEQALSGPLHKNGLDYADQPLQDVVTQLSDDYGIPIQLDKIALQEGGIGTDSKVNANLHEISLRSALELTLRPLQLTSMIHDEVLIVTTRETAEKYLETCVYNVQGLVDESDPDSIDSLIDAIVSCVHTDTWAENGGGQADVRPLPSGLLVVSQTPAIQEEVNALLNKIRKIREKAPLTKVSPHSHEGSRKHSGSGGTDGTDGTKKESKSVQTADNGGGFFRHP